MKKSNRSSTMRCQSMKKRFRHFIASSRNTSFGVNSSKNGAANCSLSLNAHSRRSKSRSSRNSRKRIVSGRRIKKSCRPLKSNLTARRSTCLSSDRIFSHQTGRCAKRRLRHAIHILRKTEKSSIASTANSSVSVRKSPTPSASRLSSSSVTPACNASAMTSRWSTTSGNKCATSSSRSRLL